MDITLLIESIMGLAGLLGILIFFLLYIPKSKNLKKSKEAKNLDKKDVVKYNDTDINKILNIIKDKNSTLKELDDAVDLLLKYHGKIHLKLGIRTHPDFDVYSEMLFRICRHPNTDKNIILKFDRELRRLNPDYVREINDSITKGLNSRVM
jgi:hypothetical protein